MSLLACAEMSLVQEDALNAARNYTSSPLASVGAVLDLALLKHWCRVKSNIHAVWTRTGMAADTLFGLLLSQ